MTTGWLNPLKNDRTTTLRPAHINTNAGVDKWAHRDLRTIISAQDWNAILALFRTAADYFGVNLPEFDDHGLRKIIEAAAGRRLTDDATLYVRTDGNDTNDGSADDAQHAFLTLQAAVNAARKIAQNGYKITIRLAAGTYSGQTSISFFNQRGTVSIEGASGAIISNSNAAAFIVSGTGAEVDISNVKFTTSGSNAPCVFASDGGRLFFGGGVEFGSCGTDQISVSRGTVQFSANYTISGGGRRFINARDGGAVIFYPGITATLTGTPSYSSEFIGVRNCALIGVHSHTIPLTSNAVTFSGAATGKRFYIDHSSSINVVPGTNLNTYIPGDQPGFWAGASLDELGAYSTGTGLDLLDLASHAALGQAAYLGRRDIIGCDLLQISGARTLTTADFGKSVICTASLTLVLPSAAELQDEWFCFVKARSGATVTIQRAGSDTIDGGTSITLSAGSGILVRRTSSSSFEGFG